MRLINGQEDGTGPDLVVHHDPDTLAMARLANPVCLERDPTLGVDVA